jgi:serine/threonine-protein kinase
MTEVADRWSRVAALFHEARQRRGSDRAAFLDGACGGDSGLRAEVDALLNADTEAGEFLEDAGPGVASLLLDDMPPAMPAGTMIGPYRVVRPLGQGGMGVVYLADDTKLGRPVTLKVLHPQDTADGTRRERLRLEARAAAALVHPNVAAVHALEEIEGQLFIVSEYVAGRTARERLDARGPLPANEAVDVALQVARGLDAAHRQGIIHRDLKPENILIGDNGVVRILDFGIARTLAPDPGHQRLTATGVMVGTPGYMAPEQLDGAAGDVRSDLFALGTVLYELVSGANPFQGKTASSTAARILTAEPVPLSNLNPIFPPALDGIVARCLKKDPAQRYASAADVVRQLDELAKAIAGGAAASAPRQGVPVAERSARVIWRIHQVVLVALLSVVAIGSWWLAAWVGQPLRHTLFAAVLALAVADGTLRVHLLFVESQTPAVIHRQLARTRLWLTRLDLLIAFIVTLAASRVVGDHQAAGTALLATSVGMAVAAWVIEPATTEAAFTDVASRRA